MLYWSYNNHHSSNDTNNRSNCLVVVCHPDSVSVLLDICHIRFFVHLRVEEFPCSGSFVSLSGVASLDANYIEKTVISRLKDEQRTIQIESMRTGRIRSWYLNGERRLWWEFGITSDCPYQIDKGMISSEFSYSEQLNYHQIEKTILIVWFQTIWWPRWDLCSSYGDKAAVMSHIRNPRGRAPSVQTIML